MGSQREPKKRIVPKEGCKETPGPSATGVDANIGVNLDYESLTKNNSSMFCVDYSKNGRAKCKKCNKTISKSELRIGKSISFKSISYLKYFHVECAFKLFERARSLDSIFTSIDELDGFNDVSLEDQSLLKGKIKECEADISRIQSLMKKQTKKEVSTSNKAIESSKKLHPSQKSSIRVFYTNADQLTLTKRSELIYRINIHKPLFVAVCEINPKNNNNVNAIEYMIPGYTLRHVNIGEGSGRGTAIFTKNELNPSISEVKTEFNEAVVLEVKLRSGDYLCFSCIYRSPTNSPDTATNCCRLNQLIKDISRNKRYSHVCFVGDFNYKHINWETWSTSKSKDSEEEKFLDALKDSFLFQHVTQPTRHRGSDEPSILDLVLTNEEMQISNIEYQSPLGKSDHSSLIFDFHCYTETKKLTESYNYNKADFDAMRCDLETTNWANTMIEIAKNETVENFWILFKEKLYSLRDKFVPKIRDTGKPHWSSKGNVPLDDITRNAIKDKLKCHRQWLRSRSEAEKDSNRVRFAKARNKVKNLVRLAKKKFEKQIADNAKSNPKPFWAYARQKLKTRSGISPLRQDPNDPTTLKYSSKDKANILQNQFCSVFSNESLDDIPVFRPRTTESITKINISTETIVKNLKALNANKSVGPDGLHAVLLKELASQVAGPLKALFDMTLAKGKLPSDWKMANIIPIFKKGSQNIAENYRPISLTSTLCKMMEHLIREAIMKHLTEHKLLSPKQYGFVSGRSTTTQLLYFIDKCANFINEGNVVDTIYFDFAKAFDSVPHQRLLLKLDAYGIKGDVFNWIKDFLVDRKQTVSVEQETSETCAVRSGVPQGTVLGPTLFVV